MAKEFDDDPEFASGLAGLLRVLEPRIGIRLRYVTEPDPAQKVLLNRLGLKLPRRLRRLDEVAQM